MLHNIEAERLVIGAILKEPAWVHDECIRRGLSDDSFHDTECRQVWQEFQKLGDIRLAEDLCGVLKRSTRAGTTDLIGVVHGMKNSLPSADYVAEYIPKIIECHNRRKVYASSQRLIRQLDGSSTQDADKAVIELQEACSLHMESGSGGKMASLLSSKRYDESIQPKDNPPIASLKDTGVIWKGNVHTLVAGSKVGKSRFLAAMIKSLVKGECSLGWSANQGGAKVIYLDFEQDHEDFYNSMHNQAGVTKDEVYAFNLAGVAANDAIACVEAALDHYPADSILVDGVADLCNDVNDPEESNALVARLMSLAVKYDVAIIGVLHLNPGSDVKSRGHLGSQLERKSKTIIQIDCDDDDVRTVYTKLARKKPISKKDGVRFQWCDMARNFVELTETKSQEQQRLEAAELREMMTEIANSRTMNQFTHKELIEALREHTGKGESTAKSMIKKMVDHGILDKSSGHYSLIKTELKALERVN